jgi:hypothetical protein
MSVTVRSLLGSVALAATLTAIASPARAQSNAVTRPIIGPISRVPEVDPATLGATLAVLAGGVLLLLDRRRQK